MMRVSKSIFFSQILVIALLATVTGVAQAQRGQFSPEQMKERLMTQATEMAKQLELSDEQMTTYLEIVTAGVEKRIELMSSAQGGGGFQGMRERFQELEEETTKALADVFTEEQLTKYKEILANRPRRGGRRQG